MNSDIRTDWFIIKEACRASDYGKLLPDALYIHISILGYLNPILQEIVGQAHSLASDSASQATLIKFNLERPGVSFLFYPSFDSEAHPELQRSIQVNLESGIVRELYYTDNHNPPVLHRKETFVHASYPLYATFAALTKQEVDLGLLRNSMTIGTRQGWRSRLNEAGVEIKGHELLAVRPVLSAKIERHKAAIVRTDLSRPVRLALELGVLEPTFSFLDYGCGHGGDVERVAALGYATSGWDPYYRSEIAPKRADIVNLGYVINVIEDQQERQDALRRAWELAQKVLIVSAQVLMANTSHIQLAYGDGIVTSRNTFQKYYEQEELKQYIDSVLQVDSVPIAPGVYLVFRDPVRVQAFRASRFHSRASVPKIQLKVKSYEDYRELLQPLVSFLSERGRLPLKAELTQEKEIAAELGSLTRAFQVVQQATGVEAWETIAECRKKEVLLYLALEKFSARPKISALPAVLQTDIKVFFGNYKIACSLSDEMLFSLGKQDNIISYCNKSAIGFKHRDSLYIHTSALEYLDPLLRLYEGCARRVFGRMDGTNVIRLRMSKPQIYYQEYEDFDGQPHPILRTSMRIDLRSLKVHLRDFSNDEDPPILLYKDALVCADYENYEKFSRFTKQEEKWNVLQTLSEVETLCGLRRCLSKHSIELRGHRIVRIKSD
jgi:DNA phosphorothioation-associated putative methyltransferase